MSSANSATEPSSPSAPLPPVVAEVVRSGLVESRHRGSYVVLAADGEIDRVAGIAGEPMYPRSANKPMQAVGMVRCGLRLPAELLALVTASHSGEDFHVRAVREILTGARLDAEALGCPAELPMDHDASTQLLRAGGGPERIRMNCSGKHAGMLATSVACGWPVENYLTADHPLQRELAHTLSELSGEPVGTAGVDGCGAPLFPLNLLGLAHAYRRLALAMPGTPEHAVAEAIRQHPRSVSGTHRDEAALVTGVPGLIAKGGAEAAYAAALPDGRAVACKIDDGGERARSVLMAALLATMGVDAEVVSAQQRATVYGGGRPVGEVRPNLAVLQQAPSAP